MRILVGIILLFTFYFWPTSFALFRNSSKKMGVFVVNFFTGWTGIGWLVALVWSFSSESSKDKKIRISSYQSEHTGNPSNVPHNTESTTSALTESSKYSEYSFENLLETKFNLKRQYTLKVALAFYFIILFVFFVAGFFIGGILGLFVSEDFDFYRFGTYLAVVFCPMVSLFVVYQKNQLNNVKFVSIALSSVIGALIFAGILGLIPAAYLTTIKRKEV